MKRSLLFIGVLVGTALAVLAAVYVRQQSAPITYSAGKGQADWLTYSSGDTGFEIRYPPDWRFTTDPKSISLTGPNDVGFSIMSLPLSVAALKRESQHGHYLPKHASHRDIVVAGLSGEQWNYRVGNFEGNLNVETFVLPRGTSTYLLSWSAGGTAGKDTPADRALCHAILSTFRFVEVRPTAYSTYEDPAKRFSFEYPSAWQLSGGLGGEPTASIRNGEATWVGISVIARTSGPEFQRQHGITELMPKTEWFTHRLSGSRARWNGNDAYIFEKDADLVIINILRNNEPAEVMTRFFDSFMLGR